MSDLQRGKYFEEFEVGMSFTSPGRTVTESDIVSFGTVVGQRVAHGLLGLAIASGLAVRTGVLEGTVIAFREIVDWKFVKPIFIGDTVHVVQKVLEVKPLPRLGGGAVNIELRLINQHDDVVMKGVWKVLVASSPE